MCFILLIIVVLLVCCVVFLHNPEVSVAATPLNVDLGDLNKFVPTLCYTDDSRMIFSLGQRIRDGSGPLVNTEVLAIYSYTEEAVEKEFTVNRDSYIYRIIPYKDGLLYSDYEFIEDFDGNVNWTVNYISDKEKMEICKGRARYYERTPAFAKIGDEVVFLCEHAGEGGYRYEVNRLVGFEAENIFTDTEHVLVGSKMMCTNNEEYCFMVAKEGDKYATLVIGDLKGKRSYTPTDGLLISYGITDKYAVCSVKQEIGENLFRQTLVRINVKTGKVSTYMEEACYRITGGQSKFCLCVDDNFQPFEINLKKGQRKALNIEGFINNENSALAFYPAGKDRIIVNYNMSEKYFLFISTLQPAPLMLPNFKEYPV